LLALSTSGCGSTLTGEQDTTIHVLAEPTSPGGTALWRYTDIHVAGDINSVGPATLLAVTLALDEPSPVSDLSFLSTLQAQAAGTTLATLTTPTRDEQSVSLHIDYFGDLHPLFESSTTIHIVWTGTLNPAVTVPAAGVSLQGSIKINIQ